MANPYNAQAQSLLNYQTMSNLPGGSNRQNYLQSLPGASGGLGSGSAYTAQLDPGVTVNGQSSMSIPYFQQPMQQPTQRLPGSGLAGNYGLGNAPSPFRGVGATGGSAAAMPAQSYGVGSYAPMQQSSFGLPGLASTGASGTLGGALPFASGAAGLFSQTPAQGYQNAYLSALNLNQTNYNNVLAGYNTTAANQKAAQTTITGGYTNLGNSILSPLQQAQGNVQAGYGNLGQTVQGDLQPMSQAQALQQSTLPQIQQGYASLGQSTGAGYGALNAGVQGTIKGISASQQQAINDQYAAAQGANEQSLISRGLGNSTILDSTSRGLTLDQQKANIALANQMAALSAGYQANIGLAGLGTQTQVGLQGLQQQSQGLQQQVAQDNTLANTKAGYASQIGQQGLQNAAQNYTQNANIQSQIGQSQLAYANIANQQNTALAEAQLAWENSVKAGYPDPNAYMALAQMLGAAQKGAPGGQVAAPGGRMPGGGGGGGGGRDIYDPPRQPGDVPQNDSWQGGVGNGMGGGQPDLGGDSGVFSPFIVPGSRANPLVAGQQSANGSYTFGPNNGPAYEGGSVTGSTAQWLQTPAGQQWLQTPEGQAWAQSAAGQQALGMQGQSYDPYGINGMSDSEFDAAAYGGF